MFSDRTEAGRKLAVEVAKLAPVEPVVLALPRGGVPVAAEVARAIGAPLDLVLVRKVGAPGNPELAMAAIVDGDPPDIVVNEEIVGALGVNRDELAWRAEREWTELVRRRTAYLANRKHLDVSGKTAILVDDGAATGTTMKAALRAMKGRAPAKTIVALPVAPPDTVNDLAGEADAIVCLLQPPDFGALGYHYRDFAQLTDDAVTNLMAEVNAR